MECAAAAATSFSIGSSRLFALAQQLRVYKPPLSSPFDEAGENTRKLISHFGFQESMAPVKKAAVLICLFEGDDGDMRVILTKRFSTLSTHSAYSLHYLVGILSRRAILCKSKSFDLKAKFVLGESGSITLCSGELQLD